MSRRIRLFSIVFLTLLSVYILVFNVFVISSHSAVRGWFYNKTRRPSEYVLPNIITTLLQPPSLCREPDPIFLLIVVTSSPNNFKARQSIRTTWGNFSEFNYPLFGNMHGAYTDKFLNITSKDWMQYAEVILKLIRKSVIKKDLILLV